MSVALEWKSDADDSAARERLIESYLPLVRRMARRFLYTREPYEDLVQVGSIGLIKAIDRFEPTRGVSLAAFAVPNILGEIRRYLRDASATVRVPRHEQEICARIGSTRRELTDQLQRPPSTLELAAASDLSDRDVAAALRAEHARRPVPLSEAAEVPSTDEALGESEDRLFVASGLASLQRRERDALRFRPDGVFVLECGVAPAVVGTGQAPRESGRKHGFSDLPRARLGPWRLQTPSEKRHPGTQSRSRGSEQRAIAGVSFCACPPASTASWPGPPTAKASA